MAGLKGAAETARAQAQNETGGALRGLHSIADALEMTESAGRLHQAQTALEQDTFRLIMVGRFKTGKSTLMNALLGKPLREVRELAPGLGPMPTHDLPCTATLTSIYYADTPRVQAYRFDGKVEEWSLERYLRDSSCSPIEEENEALFGPIREFGVGFPVELCQSGVTMLDSPGLDDVPQRSEVTRQAVQNCDAAIVVYRSDALAGQGERDFVARYVEGTGARVFTVINRWGGREMDDRFKAFVWNRLVTEQKNGPKWTRDANFEAQGIYFVDGKNAHDAKMNDDDAQTESSGLAQLEDDLGAFLLNERHKLRLQKFARAGEAQAVLLDQQIAQRLKALDADERQLEIIYAGLEPQIAALRARASRLPAVFDRHREACRSALRASFADETARLQEELPALLAARKLESLDTLAEVALSAVNRPKIVAEATEVCRALITDHVAVWGRNEPPLRGAQQALQGPLQALFEEVEVEVASLQSGFDAINFELTGWNGDGGDADGTGATTLTARLFDSLAAPESISIGKDWKGTAGATAGAIAGWFGGMVGSGIAIALIGTVAPAGLVVLMGVTVSAVAGGLSGGGAGMEKRVKDGVAQAMRETLARLPAEATVQLDAEADKVLLGLQSDVMARVSEVVAGQERGLLKIRETNRRDRGEKVGLRIVLQGYADEVARYRATLRTVAGDSGGAAGSAA